MSLHETVLSTPQPVASSSKIQPLHSVCAMDSNDSGNKAGRSLNPTNTSSESLGILSLDDMIPTNDLSLILNDLPIEGRQSLPQHQDNVLRSRGLLGKFKSIHDCLEKNESTVNESDLLRDTPKHDNKKNSTVNESDFFKPSGLTLGATTFKSGNQNPAIANDQMSGNISEIINRFQSNPEASINEILCDLSYVTHASDIDSGMFLTSEMAQQQLEADEKEMREKNAWIPNDSRESFISMQPSFDGKVSIGEFFQGKSEECSSIFDRDSPTNSNMIPLVNSTSIEEDADALPDKTASSVLSLTGIKNVIAGCDTPSKIVERMLQGNSSKQGKGRLSTDYMNSRASLGSPPVNNSKYAKPYASTMDLRTQSPVPNKIFSALSLNDIANKENNPVIEKNRTLTSVRSTSSLDSLPDGIHKLSSTKSELVWGCVKEGKSDVQNVTIRNTNKRRIKYLFQCNNSAFKVLNIDSQSDKGIFYLHPMETRELQISFAPNAIGPQLAQLCFTPIIHKHEQTTNRSQIPMYGYGGHVNIHVKGQTKDLSGKLWISLGCVDGRQDFVADFVVANSGVIDGFVSFSLNSKALCAYQDIDISPSSAIIKRRSEQLIRVRFRPSKSDLHLLNTALWNKPSKSSEIAAIRMISGAEINRQRLIKLYKKFPKEFEAREDVSLLRELSDHFQGESANDEVRLFKETCRSTKNYKMIQYLDSTEISLLLDKDLDQTLLPEVDESTIMFNTMIDANETSILDYQGEKTLAKFFSLEPPKVILTPPGKCADSLYLTSQNQRHVDFTIKVSNLSIVRVCPTQGRIEAGNTRVINVMCSPNNTQRREDVKVFIEIEEDVLTSVITVWPM